MLWQDERQLPAKPGGMTKYKLQNVVRDAIVPMDIGLAVNGDALVVWKLLAPGFAAKTIDCPIIAVKATPQDRTAVLIYKLLGSYRIIEAFNVHHA